MSWAKARGYLSFNPRLLSLQDKLFLILFVVDVILRFIWLDQPSGSLIFDEWYYVNVARVILGLPQSLNANGLPPYQNVPPGLDPNHEHPPLAKLMIAFSMYLLGNNAYAWRIPSVIFGSLAVFVFYLLMKKVATFKTVPFIATFLFSFDTLAFVHSRIATLDIFALAFMLVGIYWYYSGHPNLSAIGMSLSALTKITGAAGFILIVAVHFIRYSRSPLRKKGWSKFFSWFEKYSLVYFIAFLGLLTLMDRLWVGYSSAVEHIQFILNYSSGLTSQCPNGIISCPWQWLLNQIQIPYLVVNVSVTTGNVTTTHPSISFMGAMNPAIMYLTIPAILYMAYSYYEKKEDLTLLSLVWFAVTYLPFYPAVILDQRVTYLFYFLATVPAICAAVAHMITDQNPPKIVVLFYLGVVVLSFSLMFPFKTTP